MVSIELTHVSGMSDIMTSVWPNSLLFFKLIINVRTSRVRVAGIHVIRSHFN